MKATRKIIDRQFTIAFGGTIMVMLSLIVPASQAVVHYVSLSGNHDWPFTNWTDAATSIQPAIDAASNGDTVLVGPGEYLIVTNLCVTNGVHILGDTGSLLTIIEANGLSRCVYMSHTQAVLEGFTLRGGLVHGYGGEPAFPNSSGGGVLIETAGRLRNCIVTQNEAADGGGVFLYAGGAVEGCVVSSNRANNGAGIACWLGGSVDQCLVSDNLAALIGGGLATDGSATITRSTIVNNVAQTSAGLALLGAAFVENCLVAANVASEFAGGIASQGDNVIRNCSIGNNSAGIVGGGLICFSNATIQNSIIYSNIAPSSPNYTNVNATITCTYSCTTPLISGTGNITNAPQFVSAAAGDYHLSAGSPCIDAAIGSNAPNIDLDGVPRPLDGDSNGVAAVDMGAYEFSVWETNTHYVSLSGGHQWPYTNWITAATNIQTAVDAATGGESVLVANGRYVLTTEVTIATNLIVRSANGAAATLVDGGLSTRCLRLLPEAGCSLRGFTVTNGSAPGDWGGGVWMGANNALVDCVFVACTARYGGAVYASLSTVSNCTFIGNAATLSGGGLHCDGGTVLNCAFEGNSAFLGGGMLETWNEPYPQIHDSSFIGNAASAGGGACCGSLENVSAAMTNMVPMLMSITNVVGQLNHVQRTLTNMLLQLPMSGDALLQTTRVGTESRNRVATVLATGESSRGALWHCTMISNTADYGGGLLLGGLTNMTISNSVLAANHAIVGGGCFAMNIGEISQTTLFGNDAACLGGGSLVLDEGLVQHCSVVSNHAGVAGGGIMLAGSLAPGVVTSVVPLTVSMASATLLEVRDSQVSGNTAGSVGGGLMLAGGGLAESNTVAGNVAPWGGGIANWGGDLRASTLTSNTASFGGAVFALGGSTVNCTVQGNDAEWMGGGMIALSTPNSAYIRQCIVNGNTAFAGGGVAFSDSVMVEACTIKNNTAEIAGGGVFSVLGGDLRSSLVQGNAAPDGGGVYCLDGGRLLNCTLTANFASNAGGGLCVVSNAPGGPPSLNNATIVNTIIHGNVASTAANVLNIGTNVSYSYCCTFPAPEPGGVGNITNAPELTPTGRLTSTSPCIDAGTDFSAPPTDIDGETRWDDPRHSNVVSIVDIGADEFVDIDLDSMADCWETVCFGSITNRNGAGDADNDTLNDLAEYENSTSPSSADTDGDQMPDGWEVSHTLSPLADDANGDPDLDGMPNGSEYVSDTDPHNADSVLSLIGIERQFGGIRLDWKGGSNAWQILEYREDLACPTDEWLAIFALPPPTRLTNAIIDMGATNRNLFYRIRAER